MLMLVEPVLVEPVLVEPVLVERVLVEHCEAPAPAGELACHGHHRHRRALAALLETAPALVQAAVAGLGARPHRGGLTVGAPGSFPAGTACCSHDEQSTEPGVTVTEAKTAAGCGCVA
jgi:hypothetical protein